MSEVCRGTDTLAASSREETDLCITAFQAVKMQHDQMLSYVKGDSYKLKRREESCTEIKIILIP